METVPDPRIEVPTDAIVRVTSTAICGSDLHLYAVLGMYLDAGDVLGHEAMGVVEEVGSAVGSLAVGDRVVIPFNISCGTCWMCSRGLFAQCETTQVRDQGTGASLFGFSKLYGQVPGGQAEYLRVPQAQFGPVVVPDDGGPGRALPVPVRRAADRVAGRRVRRGARRRDRRRGGPRPHRADGRPHRSPPRCVPGDRAGPGARAPRDGAPARDRRHRRRRGRRRRRGGP